MEKDNMIELEEVRAMIYLPENAVKATINIDVYDEKGGEIRKVAKEMNMKEIKEACDKAERGYIDDDDYFALTDYGKMLAEKQLAE